MNETIIKCRTFVQIYLHAVKILNTTTYCSWAAAVKAEDELDVDGTIEEDLGKSRDGSRTDDEVVQRWVFNIKYLFMLYLMSEGCPYQERSSKPQINSTRSS